LEGVNAFKTYEMADKNLIKKSVSSQEDAEKKGGKKWIKK